MTGYSIQNILGEFTLSYEFLAHILWQHFQNQTTCVKWGVNFNSTNAHPNCQYLQK
jgi:hypothetical protein